MKLLVLNCGSSSIKYALYDSHTLLYHALVERIEEYETSISHILDNIGEIDAVAHRVVHGGELYTQAVLIDEKVIDTIDKLSVLAPLHNPANLAGIRAVANRYPFLRQVAVFDTSFHQTMPDYAFVYPLPYNLYTDDKIRRYGFHGNSHRYMLHAASAYLHKQPNELNLVTFHLGSGDSICAIKNGSSIDTSMGFTPLEGLMMGTRSGDIDPEILLYLHREKGMSMDQIEVLINKQSGLEGICGMHDMRDILERSSRGDTLAALAVDMFTYHAKKYLGAYMAVLGRIDAVVFTGGIGEHSAIIREKILEGLELFSITIDQNLNRLRSTEPFEITAPSSAIRILVVHTDEESIIAQESLQLLQS